MATPAQRTADIARKARRERSLTEARILIDTAAVSGKDSATIPQRHVTDELTDLLTKAGYRVGPTANGSLKVSW